MSALSLLATLVDFCGTLVILVGVLLCLRDLVHTRGAARALGEIQIKLAQALVFALSFKTGAGLLRTILVSEGVLHGGRAASVFAIIALRFFLGRTLKGQISRRDARRAEPSAAH